MRITRVITLGVLVASAANLGLQQLARHGSYACRNVLLRLTSHSTTLTVLVAFFNIVTIIVMLIIGTVA